MKKLIYIIVLSFLTLTGITAIAAEQAVDMVSYEQSWLDSKGTIALKNNTAEDIHSVSFLLEYLDMNGIPMDYETFYYNIDISPGMTKKLDIPAYEYGRSYHYYKSKAGYNHPAFKLRYELKGYNEIPNDNSNDSSFSHKPNALSNRGAGLASILMVIVLLGIYVGIYVLVAVMAQNRNRNPAIWILVSIFSTPILTCIILIMLGKHHRTLY